MHLDQIRVDSIEHARKLGIEISPALPLLEDGLRLRAAEDALARLFCMHAVAASSYGFDREKALSWLTNEGVVGTLLDEESLFLRSGRGDLNTFRYRIEAMWALAWSMSWVETIDFSTPCPRDFVRLLPNLKEAESTQRLRNSVRMRTFDDVLSTCDLAYCLHWAVRQSELEGRPQPLRVERHIIIERRHALEWLLTGEEWAEISLDT